MPASIDSIHRARTYRPFIDGLRAVAILAVVGSHTDLPGFSGGFVGVDVFFVISGYLIINQIIEDIENKRFSFFAFITRRIFRILPAFLLVMVTTLVLATTIFVQPEHKEFAESFLLSGIMLANHHYLAHQGYFDMAAFTKPLLHMWSLAVEEQFYLLAPLTLFTLSAATAAMTLTNRRRTWIAVSCGLVIVSFAACATFTYPVGWANVSFYIMPARGWEFILGGAAPYLASNIRGWPVFIIELLAILGSSLIIITVVLLDSDTLYPSYWAAIPAIGATLIIVGGLIEPRTIVARALATKPMVIVGLLSYSWYLWHWPLISFVRTLNFGESNIFEESSTATFALALAALTYHFVERPTRQWRQRYKFRPRMVVTAGVASCVTMAVIGYLWSVRIAPLMLPELSGLAPIETIGRNYPPVLHRGVLVGDSHANALEAPLQEFGHRAGAGLTAMTADCLPVLNTVVTDWHGNMATDCVSFFQRLPFQGAEFAIIAARWNYYLGLPPSDPYHHSAVLHDERARADRQSPDEILSKGLSATLAEAKRAGVERILVIGPLPEFPWYSPYCIIRAIRIGIDFCSIARANVDARRSKTMTRLRETVARFDGVRLIDPIGLFCTTTDCRPDRRHTLLFSDTNHLSPAGAERLYEGYERDFLWTFTGTGTLNYFHQGLSSRKE